MTMSPLSFFWIFLDISDISGYFWIFQNFANLFLKQGHWLAVLICNLVLIGDNRNSAEKAARLT